VRGNLEGCGADILTENSNDWNFSSDEAMVRKRAELSYNEVEEEETLRGK
jgi:hypothetical protein